MVIRLSAILALLVFPMLMPRAAVAQAPTVSAEEREALLALYKATGGQTWTHRSGWLAPPGSECHWYGVVCGSESNGKRAGELTITDLNLPNNGMTGQLPPEIELLRGLRRLALGGNTIKGPLPEVLLNKFDDGQLEVEPSSLVHDLKEVVFHVNNSSLLCSEYKAMISDGGSVRFDRKLCRENGGQQTREVYCEEREGKTYEFDLLGRFLVRSGFFASSEPRNSHRGNDTGESTVSAKRDGGVRVDRLLGTSVSDWSIGAIIEGIIARTRWSAPPREIPCSGSFK